MELDAIEPGRLRALVKEAIERRSPAEQPRALRAAEATGRSVSLGLVQRLREAGPPGAAP